MKTTIVNLAAAGAIVLAAIPALAQDVGSVDLTVGGNGVSIGDSRQVNGLRLNFRDRELRRVDGVNVTVWAPYDHPRGIINGVALGLPLTGARSIDGLAAGVFGVGAERTIRGIGVGGLGLGAGEDIVGLALGGIGMGAGRDIRGIAVGGIGAGVGRDVRGAALGGIGIGVGGNAKGLLLGGIGAGVGGDMEGVMIGGIGTGIGGNFRGLRVSGIGMGTGGDATGVQVAGIGIGAGGTLKWVSIAGVGIGAPRIEGVAVAAAVGSQQVRGFVFAPAYFKIADNGRMKGVNISAFNDVRGMQQGLAIGIFNYARTLDGVQVGLLNYAGNKSGLRLLPLVNIAHTH